MQAHAPPADLYQRVGSSFEPPEPPPLQRTGLHLHACPALLHMLLGRAQVHVKEGKAPEYADGTNTQIHTSLG